MKKPPSFITAEPYAARISDRPPERQPPSWGKIIRLTVAFLVLVPNLLFYGYLFVGWLIQSTIDHRNGPLYLDAAVRLPSPDNRIRFEADTDGTLRLIQLSTGKAVHKQRISVEDFRGITARWKENGTISLTCQIRYPLMLKIRECVWDVKSGLLKNSWSGKTLNAQQIVKTSEDP